MLSIPGTSQAIQFYLSSDPGFSTGFTQEILGNTGGATDVAFGSGSYALWYDLTGEHIQNLQLNFNVVNGASVTSVNASGNGTGGSSSNAAALWNNLGGGLNFIATGAAEFGCINFGGAIPGSGNCPNPTYAPVPADGSNPSFDGTQVFLAGTFNLDMSGHTGGSVIEIAGSSIYVNATGGAGIQILNQTLSGTNVILGTGGSAPEPVSLALLGMGLAGLAFVRRRA